MARHVVAGVTEFPPGTRRRVVVEGRALAVFNVGGAFYALFDTCPHQGGSLSGGLVVGRLDACRPGQFDYTPDRNYVKCPWHGWEFDLATGESWCDPADLKVQKYPVAVESGRTLIASEAQRYTAETVPVRVEGEYVVVDLPDRGSSA